MKILFYDTKSYDREFFEKLLPSYPGIEIKFIEANIHEETAALAHGYDAICAFVNADLGAPVIEELHEQGVKLILMRCAGYNNVDLKTAQKYGIKVLRVPGYSPEAVAEHAMALALTANRHTHKADIKCRENNFALNGLMGVNFYQKTAGIIGRDSSHFHLQRFVMLFILLFHTDTIHAAPWLPQYIWPAVSADSGLPAEMLQIPGQIPDLLPDRM